jgi:hypothetical protein
MFYIGSSRKRCTTIEEDIEEESEVIRSNTQTERQAAMRANKGKQPAARKTSTKPFDKWGSQEYINLRKKDPYTVPRNSRYTNPEYYNSQMEQIYSDCYTTGWYKVVEQRSLNLEVLRSNLSDFGGALVMCEELNLLPIMRFHCAYDEHLICQFYSTVHFTTTLPQRIKWMAKNKILEASWAEFGAILGYP